MNFGPQSAAAILSRQAAKEGDTDNSVADNRNAVKPFAPVFGGQGSGDGAEPAERADVDPFQRSTPAQTPQSEDETAAVFADEAETDPVKSAAAAKEQAKLAREQQEIEQLEARDAEVRTHEQAHASVGGQYARSPNLTFEKGPDGKRYAVDGEVSIDIAPVNGNPQATINKMQQVYAAAMAPVNPSAADLQVAAEALRNIEVAKRELRDARLEAAPAPEQLKPLYDAKSDIEEQPELEPVKPSLGGRSVDAEGELVSSARDTNPASELIDTIMAKVANERGPLFEERSSDNAAVTSAANSSINLSPPKAILAYRNTQQMGQGNPAQPLQGELGTLVRDEDLFGRAFGLDERVPSRQGLGVSV
ncbi:putative metalloprotease CJM1_0395 family protein [Shewanella cyperi]